MRPLTATMPKALVEINGVSMLDRAISNMREIGVEDIRVLASRRQKIERPGIQTIYDTDFEGDGIVEALRNGMTDDSEYVVVTVDFIAESNPLKQLIAMRPPAVLWDIIKVAGNYGIMQSNGIVEQPAIFGKKGVLGLGYYPSSVRQVISDIEGGKTLSDINNVYTRQGRLNMAQISCEWVDAGTFEGLTRAKELV